MLPSDPTVSQAQVRRDDLQLYCSQRCCFFEVMHGHTLPSTMHTESRPAKVLPGSSPAALSESQTPLTKSFCRTHIHEIVTNKTCDASIQASE